MAMQWECLASNIVSFPDSNRLGDELTSLVWERDCVARARIRTAGTGIEQLVLFSIME